MARAWIQVTGINRRGAEAVDTKLEVVVVPEIGQADPNWPDWYAQYLVDERNGQASGA
jgi:hypothetical protein